MRPSDMHIIELLGKTRVVIERGEVVEVGEPLVRYCPLWEKLGIKEINKNVVKARVEFQMRDFGLCSPERRFDLGVFVDFGASETLMTALRSRIIDAAVSVCDGAGTVITSNPALVQGIGARISGIVETSPIDAVLKKLSELGGFALKPPRISQADGLKVALEMGHSRVGVTVTSVEDAERCRELSDDAVILGVHLTGLSEEEAARIFEVADVVTACASAPIREMAREKSLIQAGISVPMFAVSHVGKDMLLERVREMRKKVVISAPSASSLQEKQPKPLI